jgi:hypothetical protein
MSRIKEGGKPLFFLPGNNTMDNTTTITNNITQYKENRHKMAI